MATYIGRYSLTPYPRLSIVCQSPLYPRPSHYLYFVLSPVRLHNAKIAVQSYNTQVCVRLVIREMQTGRHFRNEAMSEKGSRVIISLKWDALDNRVCWLPSTLWSNFRTLINNMPSPRESKIRSKPRLTTTCTNTFIEIQWEQRINVQRISTNVVIDPAVGGLHPLQRKYFVRCLYDFSTMIDAT